MSEIDIDILQPGDFAADQFYLDAATKKMRMIAGAGGGSNMPPEMMEFVAGGVISGDKALMFASDGTVVMADPMLPTYVYVGIAVNSADKGGIVLTVKERMISASFWTWDFGRPIFVAPGGNLTQVPPSVGYSHIIGRAVTPTSIYLVEEDIIDTGA